MKKLFASLLLFALTAGSTEPTVATPGKALGVPTAPITIEVYSDYECPHCKLLYEDTLRPLMRDYVAKGKVYLIHRDFPLPQHRYAKLAAYYADAAVRLNKYEEVCAALFSQQSVWSQNGNIEASLSSVLNPMEMLRVRQLVKDPKIVADVERDIAMGQKIPIRQTPTMMITHKGQTSPVTSSVTYSLLTSYLNDLLAK
jgi:protein-disulfide isomerase